jgi:hypothetical protein
VTRKFVVNLEISTSVDKVDLRCRSSSRAASEQRLPSPIRTILSGAAYKLVAAISAVGRFFSAGGVADLQPAIAAGRRRLPSGRHAVMLMLEVTLSGAPRPAR